MKATIKIKLLNENCKPSIITTGEWIDLRAAEDIKLDPPYANIKSEKYQKKVSFATKYIPLGVAMKLPKGYEAIVVSRSSTAKRYNVLQTNALGVIDGKQF